jgi:hypothetical protein
VEVFLDDFSSVSLTNIEPYPNSNIILTVKFKMKGKTAGKAPNKKKIERPGLTEDEIEELREAFNLFDTEGTGKIDPR